MAGEAERRQIGYFQMAVVVAVAALLAGLFMQRAGRTAAYTESVALRLFERQVTTRLAEMRVGMLQGGSDLDPRGLVGTNPLGTVVPSIDGYLGERSGVDWTEVEPGAWVWAADERSLVYRVVNERYFSTDLRGPARVRYQLAPKFADDNGNGRWDEATERIFGLQLVTREPYRWDIP